MKSQRPVDSVFDAAVVGGGPAGATVAALLARSGLTVVLCDAARFPRHKICGEYVQPGAVRALARLGLHEEVERLRPVKPIGMAIVSPDGTKVLGRHEDPSERGLSVRRYDLDHVLLNNARRSGAVVLEGHRATDFTRGTDGLFDLELRPPGADRSVAATESPGATTDRSRANTLRQMTIRARALVGADGRNSQVARRLGLWRAEPRHRRWAIMGHFSGVDTPEDHGEMIVTPYGYCGLNPLPGGLTNVCIVIDPLQRRGSLPGRAGLRTFFDQSIASHPLTRDRMAHSSLADGLWATGPMACRAARSTADGVVLVGDAAGFYDPFTGEGIAMALRGAEMAAEVLREAIARDDLRASALAAYEAERRTAFAARLRLDRLLQSLLARPGLTDWMARKLHRDQALADLLARVAGDTVDASELFRPRFVARLLLA